MIRLHARNLRTRNISLKNAGIFRVSKNRGLPISERSGEIYRCSSFDDIPDGFAGYLIVGSEGIPPNFEHLDNVICLPYEFEYLEDGDVVRINPFDQSIRVLYRLKSPNNYFLLTERCNSFCIMCSQPPRDIDDSYLMDDVFRAIPLIDPSTREIGLTGGEPTLYGSRLVDLIRKFHEFLPNTSLHVLTNGRRFSNHKFASEFEDTSHNDCMFGIPLYSDLPEIHDYIVQAHESYDQTIKGILNLKRYKQKVEIRIVVQKENYQHLPRISEFIARNLTFVDQVVFMGLEPTGFAKVNMAAIWIDPYEYQEVLANALRVLDEYRIINKVYNIQLCLLHPSALCKSVNSISDWKREYVAECNQCLRKDNCCGVFGTGTARHSANLRAFK